MASKKAARRAKLFDLYVANARLHAEDHCHGGFWCPICLRGFTRQAIEHPLGVNLAHIYPESCGGRLESLACLGCNSRLGRFEPDFARWVKANLASSDPKAPTLKAKLVVDGNAMPIRWREVNGDWKIEQERNTGGSPQAKAVVQSMIAGNFKGTVQFDGWNDIHCNVVALHAAYMLLFYTFGYEYIAYAKTDWIREILLRESHTENFLLLSAEATLPMPAKFLHRAGIVVTGGMKAACAIFPSPVKDRLARVVFLPGKDDPKLEHYCRLEASLVEGTEGLRFHVPTIPPRLRLADPKHRFEFNRFWDAADENAT